MTYNATDKLNSEPFYEFIPVQSVRKLLTSSTVENPAATQAEATTESVQPGGQPAPADSQSAMAAATPTAVELPVTSSGAPALSADAQPNQTQSNQTQPNQAQPNQTESNQAELTASAAVSDSSTQAPVSESEQRIQQMQNMFQQRKQMIEDSRKPPAN